MNQSPGAVEVQRDAAEVRAETAGARLDLAERQIAKLIAEIKAARADLAEQKKLVKSLDEQLSVEIKNSASLELSYESAQREVAALQTAIDAKNETIKVLTEQRDKERNRAKKANKRAALAAISAAALIILRFVH